MSKLNFFINFKPENIAYGGGNVFALNLIEYLKKNNINVKLSKFELSIIFLIFSNCASPPGSRVKVTFVLFFFKYFFNNLI